jgi:hypothetical protein
MSIGFVSNNGFSSTDRQQLVALAVMLAAIGSIASLRVSRSIPSPAKATASAQSLAVANSLMRSGL